MNTAVHKIGCDVDASHNDQSNGKDFAEYIDRLSRPYQKHNAKCNAKQRRDYDVCLDPLDFFSQFH